VENIILIIVANRETVVKIGMLIPSLIPLRMVKAITLSKQEGQNSFLKDG
jgi:hypothetical protein